MIIACILVLLGLIQIGFVRTVYNLEFWRNVKYYIPYKPKYQYNFKFDSNEELGCERVFLSVFHVKINYRTYVIVLNSYKFASSEPTPILVSH